MAQWIEHPTSNRGVAGSSPARGIIIFLSVFVAQWLAHPTSNREVAGSSPAKD